MGRSLKVLYWNAAQEFARRVVASLGNEVGSIVLFGSAARGEAKRHSDIDIMLISRNPDLIRDRVSRMRSDLTYDSKYAFFLSLVHLRRRDLSRIMELGSPFMQEVAIQGVMLYDNGTFARVHD